MDGQMESQMVSKKNNLPNGWTDGELNEWLENNSPNLWTDEELSGQLENDSTNGWTDRELTLFRVGYFMYVSQVGWGKFT